MMPLRSDAELIDRYWHFGCFSDELTKEGDYLLYKLGVRDVVLYHDGKEIIAFDNRCPHRGTQFFDSHLGNQKAVCKYHGWSFTRGRLIIPLEMELMVNCPKPQLNSYRTEWCGTFLFFAITPASELLEQLGEDLFALIESISFDCCARKDFNHYIYECPWQVSIENALEPQHLPFVHPETLNKLEMTNCHNSYWGPNSGVYLDIGNSAMQKGLQRIGQFYDRSNHVHHGYMSLYLFPFCFISSTAGTSYSVQSFFPRDGGSTWFKSRLYAVRLANQRHEAVDAALIKAAIDMNHRVFEEDHAICRRISEDAWRRSLENTLYSSEEKIVAFRKQLETPSNLKST